MLEISLSLNDGERHQIIPFGYVIINEYDRRHRAQRPLMGLQEQYFLQFAKGPPFFSLIEVFEFWFTWTMVSSGL
jgi:hypothetical protein